MLVAHPGDPAAQEDIHTQIDAFDHDVDLNLHRQALDMVSQLQRAQCVLKLL